MTEPTLCRSYAPKEIALFEATLRLLGSGKDLHELKISQIAAEAGIGKGTVYEYFDSKETLIGRTLLYCLEAEQRKAGELIRQVTCFKDAVFVMFDVVKANLANPMSSFWLLSSGIQAGKKIAPALDQTLCADHMARSLRQVEQMLAFGRAEGLVSDAISDDEGFLALKSAAAAYLTPPLCARLGDEAMRDIAYRLLLKMLA